MLKNTCIAIHDIIYVYDEHINEMKFIVQENFLVPFLFFFFFIWSMERTFRIKSYSEKNENENSSQK